MTLPAALLGFVIATLFGSLFHIWRGGKAGRFLLYLFLSWIGFWTGHFLGLQMQLTFLNIGPLYTGTASILCILFLVIGHWLSLVETGRH
jgi:hypothetical protein